MTRSRRGAFRRLLRGLDRDELAAFVADLWTARGWTATVEGETVVVVDPRSRTRRRFHVAEPSVLSGIRRPEWDGDVDAVVSVGRWPASRAADRSDAEYVDASTLYEVATHAMDRATREELFRTHFGRATVPRGAVTPAGRVADRARTVLGTDVGRSAAALGLVAALVVGAAVLSAGPLVGGTGGATAVTPAPIDAPGPPDRSAVNPRAGTTATTTPVAGPGDWPMVGYGPARTGHGVRARGPDRAAETTTVDLEYPIITSPVVADGGVYVGRYDGTLFRIDASRMAVEWRTKVGSRLISSPAVANGTVYVATTEGEDGDGPGYDTNGAALIALSAADGDVRWRVPVGAVIRSSPAVADGTVYVASVDTRVYAFDVRTGSQRWTASVGGSVHAPAAVARGTVYVTTDESVSALDARTGSEVWTASTGRPATPPVVANGTVYVGSSDGQVHAFDARTGSTRWDVFTSGAAVSPPAVANGTVHLGDEHHRVYAIDGSTGRKRWVAPVEGLVLAAPVVADGTVYVGTGRGTADAGGPGGNLYALDASTGAVRWHVSVSHPVEASPAVGDGALYVGGYDGHLRRIAGCPAGPANRTAGCRDPRSTRPETGVSPRRHPQTERYANTYHCRSAI